jgi:hypothetical protein
LTFTGAAARACRLLHRPAATQLTGEPLRELVARHRVEDPALIGSYIAIPFVQILLGPIAAATGIDTALAACGLVIWIAVAAMVASASVRRLEHHSEAVVV